MDDMNDAPADQRLQEARESLQGLMRSGLSRETLFNLLNSTNPEPPRNSTPSQLPTHQEDEVSHDVKSEAPIDAGVFYPRPGPYSNHRTRISVSSTSSGSSGKASIWSTAGSFNSAVSNATHYSAPLPPPPAQSQNKAGAASPGSAPATAAAGQGGWGSGRLNFYWCTSCETRFKRKYDWKRHEEEFHERWKKYPCPEPGCNRSFWGANTFNQHHKSSHGCKTCPHSEKVVKYLRKRKYWACGFCAALHPSRERHVEHVARHFESGKTKADWHHSKVIYGLLHQPLIHEAWKDIMMTKQVDFSGRAPNFSWNPQKTGRQQGFMENECPGQLQDLLEFFSGSSADAEPIAKIAYEGADIIYPMNFNSPTSCGDPNNVMSYPTPPETTLSPITPGSTIPTQPQPQQHQQAMMEPTSPTPFPIAFKNAQPMMQPIFNLPQPPHQSSQEPLRRSSLERPLPPPPPGPGDVTHISVAQAAASGAPTLDLSYLHPGDNMMIDDWGSIQSFATTVVDDTIPAPTQVQQEWPMMSYNFSQQGS